MAGSNLIGNSFGMFMCLPKENYVPIPEDLTMWGGDDWLFFHQPWPNWALIGPTVRGEVSVTSREGQFQRLLEREGAGPPTGGVGGPARVAAAHTAPQRTRVRDWREPPWSH